MQRPSLVILAAIHLGAAAIKDSVAILVINTVKNHTNITENGHSFDMFGRFIS